MINEDRLIDYLSKYVTMHPENPIMLVSSTQEKASELQRKVLKQVPLALTYAVSIGGMTFGCRSNLIVMYNCITEKNKDEYDKQLMWYLQSVRTRLLPRGEVIMIESSDGESA